MGEGGFLEGGLSDTSETIAKLDFNSDSSIIRMCVCVCVCVFIPSQGSRAYSGTSPKRILQPVQGISTDRSIQVVEMLLSRLLVHCIYAVLY